MLLLPLSIALASLAAEPPAPVQTPAGASLVAAEYAFADQSAKDGVRAAFLGAFHKDGLVYIPRPVNAIAYYQTQLIVDNSLTWFPIRVEASSAGDLGYSTGPWTFRASKDASDAVYGWFVSIWERDGNTPWKVRLDLGINTPDPSDLPKPTALPRTAAALPPPPAGAPTASPELMALDSDFGKETARNIPNAIMTTYKARVDAGVRLYRKGRFPLEGVASLQRYLDPWAVEFQPSEAIVSSSSDLGMTRGTLTRKDPAGAQTSYYTHIWKKVGGQWKLVVEVEIPTK